MTMLRQLDKLGEVGTRVLNKSTDNIVASLRHLQPTLTKLADAGDSLANGLSMLASFPFPKEAANIVRGDYANALFHMDINLNDDHQVAGRCPAQRDRPVRRPAAGRPCARRSRGRAQGHRVRSSPTADVRRAALPADGRRRTNSSRNPMPDLARPAGQLGSSGSSGGSGGLGGLLGGGGGG